MSPTSQRLTFWLALVLLLLGLPARGASTDETEDAVDAEERQEAIERHSERAWKAFRSGNHDEVLARMDRVERYDPDNVLPAYLRARVAVRTGDLELARTVVVAALARHPEHAGLQSLLYEVLLDLGRYEDVVEVSEARVTARPDDAAAHAARGLALEGLGRRQAAIDAYDAVIDAFNRRSSAAEDLPWVARAAIRVTRLSENPADDLLPQALKLLGRWLEDHPDDQDVQLEVADLYQQDRGPRGQSLAAKRYREILEENSEVAPARVGLARTFLVFYQQDRAIQQLERALQTNPKLVPALSLLASIHIANGDYEKADELLTRARDANSRDKEARAVQAARARITGDETTFERLEQEALAQDPKDGRFYVTVSELVGERQRRYDAAATLARQAIETDPNDPLAYTVLGEALMNLGQTEEARATFQAAVAKSKRYADVKRDNWLEVLDVLDGFRTDESTRFLVRMHPSEEPVMRRYLGPLLEEAFETLSRKYGFTPSPPVRVDSFHRADDFSVRSIGVAGLPALGVCFGNVITLLGPTSRPLGSFSWARTAWHEFAHTITLGLSQGQVPRWLTEGLSVYEEKMRRPQWGREMDRELYNRLHNDRLLRMSEINRAFRGPDIMFAYFQGGLIAEHLTQTRGFDVIPAMLREFAQDRTTEAVFREVLQIELADYDRQFREFVQSQVGGYRMVPVWDDESMAAFLKRVEADPKDAEAQVRLGWALLQRGVAIDAGGRLAKAKALAPEDPEVVLLEGRLAETSGRTDLAKAAYDRFLAAGSDDVHVRLFLAQMALLSQEDAAAAKGHLEAAKRCFPTLIGKDSPYLALAKLYEAESDVDAAIREYEGYAAIAGEDYGVRKKLRDVYRTRGDQEALARVCEEMIDISPFGANPGRPPDVELHRVYADCLEALGRADEALRELEVQVDLISLLPEEARIEQGAVTDHIRLGRRYLRERRPLDALSQAAAALRLSPDDASARILKGEAEEAAGYR